MAEVIELPKKKTATASDLRSKRILVDVPGTDWQLECRRPDPIDLITHDALSLPLYGAILDGLNGQSGLMTIINSDPKTFADFVDGWVCAAVINPRVVATRELAEHDDEAIWVEDLEPEVRLAVFRHTNDRLVSRRVSNALAEFREQQTLRDRPRPSGEAVPHTPQPTFVHA